MKRRAFVTTLGAAGLAACAAEQGDAPAGEQQRFSWRMVTTWPPNFPGLGTGAANLARLIGEASGGRLRIQVLAAGELVPAFEVFDTVSRGTAEMGHGASYYWRSRSEAAQLFTSVPFGLNAQEMDAWLYYGGGLDLWREVYAPFGVVPFPAGNTGVQMGGWFRREINSPADLQGLRMRIPGLGGEVLRRAGGTPVTLPGSEIFTTLQRGGIEAAEWVGPYNDVAFGLHQAARYYYYPGWQEPGPTLECIVNQRAWASLPADLQAIVRIACQAINCDMLAEYAARNARALRQLLDEGRIELRRFPDSVLARLRDVSERLMADLAERDEVFARVWASQRDFRTLSAPWQAISEQAVLEMRDSGGPPAGATDAQP
ncbi:MAG: TRAP transporter substrate-binding protein DctP [Gammaproteobacteria bacterium]|nr:TRAP transporter substrate-binding protein DctP [Gammaproteobacteria bacterium]